MNYEEHFQKSAELRETFWQKTGKVDPYVISHLINPAFSGGPAWPSLRQAFKKADTPRGSIIASDGLSDPYNDFDSNPDNQAYNGIGCEMYIECDEAIDSVESMKNSWQFSVLYQASQLAAGNPNISNTMRDYGYVSTELYHCKVPKDFLNEHERAGVLLGLESTIVPKELSLSLESILLINVTLLTLSELKYITQNGVKGRQEVAELLLKQDKPGKSYLDRVSVV